MTLATVKALAPIELVPPNRLVARDAFDGVLADVILEWRHNRFGQSVVLREQPLLPESLDPVTTRLAVITEFVEAPEPEINRVIAQADGQAQAEDHVTISFEGVSILLGHAFAVSAADGEAGLSLGTIRARDQAVPVRKTWEPLPGGGGVLVESISLAETAPLWEGLPRQARAEGVSGRDWRTTRTDRTGESRPVELALSAYQPAGVIVDFEQVPSCSSGICTLRMGKTYYVHSSYYMGPGAVHFEPGCTVKLTNNAYVLVYGPLTFPNTLQTPVFTSHADDGFGEDIDGIQGSVPTHHAYPALWVYYVNFSTTVKSSRFRWAKMAVRYDGNPGVTVPHYVQNSLFENCQTGIQNSTPGSTIVLSGVEMQNVQGPVSGPYPIPSTTSPGSSSRRHLRSVRLTSPARFVTPG
ncbi:MAG: hypothetical protein M5U12_37900 [Verrucomicrobia bacterium]|nr:hypothetical protein [Verrucomicrobiota bacterium]